MASESVSTHVVNVVQSPVRQGGPLHQPQVSTDEQLSSGDRRRVLHISKALHHHCGHALGKHNNIISFTLAGTLTKAGLDGPGWAWCRTAVGRLYIYIHTHRRGSVAH